MTRMELKMLPDSFKCNKLKCLHYLSCAAMAQSSGFQALNMVLSSTVDLCSDLLFFLTNLNVKLACKYFLCNFIASVTIISNSHSSEWMWHVLLTIKLYSKINYKAMKLFISLLDI